MNKPTTLCFGRFLIDLPAGAQIKEIGQQSEFKFGRINSERFEGGAKEFATKMLARQAELRARHDKDKFELVDSREPATNSRIFKLSKKLYTLTNFGFEAYRLTSDNVLFSMLERDFLEEKIEFVLHDVQTKLLPNLRTRMVDEIPLEPGFCIKDGFIPDNGESYHFEEARIHINFKEWPDVWVSIHSQTVPKAGDESLLTRIDKHPETPLEKAYIKTFRRGKREVNGLRGEELLDLLPTEDGIKQHYFHWEALGEVKSIFAPLLDLELETAVQPLKGPRPRSSLTDDQAIKLYDAIVNTIRVRPTSAPVKTNVDEPPKKPLGERAATGSTCPQTGWWQSEDEDVVAEWRRRHFKAGDVLPMAQRQGQPSLWQQVKGERSIQRFSAIWQLVEYGEAPEHAAKAAPKQTPASLGSAAGKRAEPPNEG